MSHSCLLQASSPTSSPHHHRIWSQMDLKTPSSISCPHKVHKQFLLRKNKKSTTPRLKPLHTKRRANWSISSLKMKKLVRLTATLQRRKWRRKKKKSFKLWKSESPPFSLQKNQKKDYLLHQKLKWSKPSKGKMIPIMHAKNSTLSFGNTALQQMTGKNYKGNWQDSTKFDQSIRKRAQNTAFHAIWSTLGWSLEKRSCSKSIKGLQSRIFSSCSAARMKSPQSTWKAWFHTMRWHSGTWSKMRLSWA